MTYSQSNVAVCLNRHAHVVVRAGHAHVVARAGHAHVDARATGAL